jgi:uncharacterized FAD-dependent dehydrogenase
MTHVGPQSHRKIIYILNKPIKGAAMECPFSSNIAEILPQDNQNILNYLL